MTLLSIALTAAIQIVDVDVPCGSLATFSGHYEGDLTITHRVELEAFDADGHLLGNSWVEEYYVPATDEQLVLMLGPDVRYLRCSAFGPGLQGEKSGRLEITYNPPQLLINVTPDGKSVELKWLDGHGCWQPQKLTGIGWVDCERVEPIEGVDGYFRLRPSKILSF